MQNFNLFNYLLKNRKSDGDLLECLKFELDMQVYYYGQQFIHPKEVSDSKKRIKQGILHQLLERGIRTYQLMFKRNALPAQGKFVVSNAYFTLDEELNLLNYAVYHPIWSPKWSLSGQNWNLYDKKLYGTTNFLKEAFSKGTFRELIISNFIEKVRKFKLDLKDLYLKKNIQAIFIPNDIGFFESLSIKIFKEIKKPSFIFLHGLPGRYNLIDENRSDYLIVWGEKIKTHYVQTGFDAKKIFVAGHPYYKEFQNHDLKNKLDDVLVLTKAMNGAQYSDGVRLTDRGNLILYLYSIQRILREFGVKSVRFRPHPVENGKWYSKFIDRDFFKLDEEGLSNSITRSSLVIGPSSTVFLESLYYGVNYIVYEPSLQNIDLTNFPLVPPFDGSDKRVPVAKNEDELRNLLREKVQVDSSIFNDYIKTPFNLNFVKDLI